MALTLAEEFLLLAYHDVRGKPMVDGQKLAAALAGAAVVDLVLTGALRLDGNRLAATGVAATDPRLAELTEVADGRRPKDAISKIAGFSAWRNRSADIQAALLSDLAAAGVLRVEEGRVLGLFRTMAWMPGDPSTEAAVLDRVASVVVRGNRPDDRTAALISILHAIDLLPRLFPDAAKREIRRRGKEISESDWGGAAVRKAVQEIQAVMVAVMIAATTTAASS